jgi:transcriptional regulator with XRE-family HTH domain
VGDVDPFPLAGVLRRIRRTADWSQRELADRIGASRATVAAAERGTRDLPVSLLARVAEAAGGRLTVLDLDGAEVVPMSQDTVRDRAGRHFPAHLDTRHGDDDWWGGPHRPRLRAPDYTFDLSRRWRDRRRGAATSSDHHRPEPGDSLAERATARRDEAARARATERERRLLEGLGVIGAADWGTGCSCTAGCEYVEGTNEDLQHDSACTCRCDVD